MPPKFPTRASLFPTRASQVPDTRFLVPDTRFLVPDPWFPDTLCTRYACIEQRSNILTTSNPSASLSPPSGPAIPPVLLPSLVQGYPLPLSLPLSLPPSFPARKKSQHVQHQCDASRLRLVRPFVVCSLRDHWRAESAKSTQTGFGAALGFGGWRRAWALLGLLAGCSYACSRCHSELGVCGMRLQAVDFNIAPFQALVKLWHSTILPGAHPSSLGIWTYACFPPAHEAGRSQASFGNVPCRSTMSATGRDGPVRHAVAISGRNGRVTERPLLDLERKRPCIPLPFRNPCSCTRKDPSKDQPHPSQQTSADGPEA